jgi:hypothetical protein
MSAQEKRTKLEQDWERAAERAAQDVEPREQLDDAKLSATASMHVRTGVRSAAWLDTASCYDTCNCYG